MCRLDTGLYLRWWRPRQVGMAHVVRDPIFTTDINDAWLMPYAKWLDVLPTDLAHLNDGPKYAHRIKLGSTEYHLLPVCRHTFVFQGWPLDVDLALS